MANKAVAKSAKQAGNDLEVPRVGSGTLERGIAEMAVEGVAPNALVALAFSRPSGFGNTGLSDSVLALRGHIERVKSGDLSGPEGLLVSQAYTLNAVFTELARKAAENLGHYPDAVDRYLRLAFKAQSQSRCAIEALNEMKNPRQPVFAKQANITSGPQQVNNHGAPRAEDQEAIPPNKQLEVQDAEWVDARAARTAEPSNPEVAAVATVHRPDFARGKVRMRAERVERRQSGSVA